MAGGQGSPWMDERIRAGQAHIERRLVRAREKKEAALGGGAAGKAPMDGMDDMDGAGQGATGEAAGGPPGGGIGGMLDAIMLSRPPERPPDAVQREGGRAGGAQNILADAGDGRLDIGKTLENLIEAAAGQH